MLKTVSSIANAIGALNYKGTWDANANSPVLASSVGTKGDYYVVSTAGTTSLNGISNWGIGDWAVFNGSVWQRVEGGADLNGVNLSVTGTSQLTGNATFSDNLVQGTAAKGVNFTANTPTAGMTSQLLNAYEEGTWTPDQGAGLTVVGTFASSGYYTKVGRLVTVYGKINPSVSVAVNSGAAITNTLPFTATIPGCGVTSNISASATATNLVGSASTVLYSNTVISATGQIEFTATYYA